jgi:hypothetical protein
MTSIFVGFFAASIFGWRWVSQVQSRLLLIANAVGRHVP